MYSNAHSNPYAASDSYEYSYTYSYANALS
jgi:hypothetical protein